MLHHVVEYAKKNVQDSEPGFTKRPIHWLLHISTKGQYKNIEPYGERKRGKQREERCPDMPNMRAGKNAKRAHFLVENAQAAALFIKDKERDFKEDEDKTVRRNAFFRKLLNEVSESFQELKPASVFFESEDEVRKLRFALADNGALASDWVMFQVGNVNPLRDERILDWWRSWLARDTSSKTARKSSRKSGKNQFLDLISGELINPKDRHPPLKGLEDVGGNKSGAPLVCFDKQAFGSFRLKEGDNAPMSDTNAQLYVDGLSHLLKQSRVIAGARVVYWYREEVLRPDDPIAWMDGLYTDEQKEAGVAALARDLLMSIEAGKRPGLFENHYFAMTLSGAAGRAMVRDWMEDDFKGLVTNVGRWFSDMEITAITGMKRAPDQKFETTATSLLPEKRQEQKYSDWVKPIGSARNQLLRAAIEARTISPSVLARVVPLLPSFFISDAIQRALFPKNDKTNDASTGLSVSRLYARMGLIKAYLVRLQLGGNNTMQAYLNPKHPEPAYHCGRWLAVLADLQYDALGSVGAGVVQRYYAAVSQTPGLFLGRLVRNAQFHLNKSDNSSKYEEPMIQIAGELKDRIPAVLDLEGQGLFALGYYQQLAALRAGSKNTTTESTTAQGETK